MLYFSALGYRVVAHDRRGHGRSSPSARGNDMDTYAADVAAITTHLEQRAQPAAAADLELESVGVAHLGNTSSQFPAIYRQGPLGVPARPPREDR
jgi:pimeloyl-ACP methyl ester carboxylesterase